MPGAQQQPKPTHPSRSHSLSSASSSFLSRLSSRTLSSLSPSTTTPTSFSPRSSIITLIVTLLSLLASNSNSLSRSQASQFVTTLDAIGFYDLKIAQDVRQGVQTGFGRGGEELVTYLRWVEGELRRGGSGELEGGGLSSWGWDVSRVSSCPLRPPHTFGSGREADRTTGGARLSPSCTKPSTRSTRLPEPSSTFVRSSINSNRSTS